MSGLQFETIREEVAVSLPDEQRDFEVELAAAFSMSDWPRLEELANEHWRRFRDWRSHYFLGRARMLQGDAHYALNEFKRAQRLHVEAHGRPSEQLDEAVREAVGQLAPASPGRAVHRDITCTQQSEPGPRRRRSERRGRSGDPKPARDPDLDAPKRPPGMYSREPQEFADESVKVEIRSETDLDDALREELEAVVLREMPVLPPGEMMTDRIVSEGLTLQVRWTRSDLGGYRGVVTVLT